MIPDGWSEARLGDLFDVKSSKRVLQSDWRSSGVPFYRGREITELSKRGEVDNDLFIDRALFEELSSRFGVPARGDILVSAIGTIGNVFLVRGDHEFYFKDASVLWLSSKGVSESSFVVQWMRSPGFQTQLPTGNGTTVDTLTIGILGDLHVPLPPLDEQRAIAEALSDADALVESLDALIAKKRHMKQAAMQQLLTGRTRFPGFTDEWQMTLLREVLDFEVGFPFDSGQFHPYEGIRLVRNADLKSDAAVVRIRGAYPANYLVADGDLLIGMDGDFVPVLWKGGEALLNQRVGRVRTTSKSDTSYMSFALLTPLKEIEHMTSATTVKHLSHSDVIGIRVPLPSVDEQKAIAQALSDMDAEIDALVAQREKEELVKQGIMQELLSGRVRLA